MKTKNVLKAGAFVICGALLFGSTGCSKKEGCTDPVASNYNPEAEKDDGSCDYKDEQAYNKADGILGGKLYDKFWATETGWTAPSGINVKDISDYGDFYRCKQCHGWDLEGKYGAYIDRAPKKNRPNIDGSLKSFISSNTNKAIFDGIKNTGGRAVNTALTQDGTNGQGDAHPDYGTILTDAQIWNIVKYLKEEALDVTQLYTITTTGMYPTGTKSFSNIGKNGNATNGDTYYANNCKSCHGNDGALIDLEGMTVGKIGRTKPNELQHKVKFGQLGSSMGSRTITLQEMKDLYKALQNATKYTD